MRYGVADLHVSFGFRGEGRIRGFQEPGTGERMPQSILELEEWMVRYGGRPGGAQLVGEVVVPVSASDLLDEVHLTSHVIAPVPRHGHAELPLAAGLHTEAQRLQQALDLLRSKRDTQHLLDPGQPERQRKGLPRPWQHLHDRPIDLAARRSKDDLQGPLHCREVSFRVDSPLESVAGIRGDAQSPPGPADGLRLEESALEQDLRGLLRYCRVKPTHDATDVVGS